MLVNPEMNPRIRARNRPNVASMLALMAERKKTAAEFPNVVDYESKRAFVHLYDAAPLPAEGTPTTDVGYDRWQLDFNFTF